MIADAPTLDFAYAQLGQENSFGWPEMADAYLRQMEALAALRDEGAVHVETVGDSGRRFKRAFRETPAQAQVMLEDPFGNPGPLDGTVWYATRFYRADLHFKDGLPYLRDLTVYSDANPQPFLTQATKAHDVEQRMPAVLDGYHWSRNPGSPDESGAGGYFYAGDERLRLSGKPQVREEGSAMIVDLPVGGGRILRIRFEERGLSVRLTPKVPLTLSFEWWPPKSALAEVGPERVAYRWPGFDYAVRVRGGKTTGTHSGWSVGGEELKLVLSQHG